MRSRRATTRAKPRWKGNWCTGQRRRPFSRASPTRRAASSRDAAAGFSHEDVSPGEEGRLGQADVAVGRRADVDDVHARRGQALLERGERAGPREAALEAAAASARESTIAATSTPARAA